MNKLFFVVAVVISGSVVISPIIVTVLDINLADHYTLWQRVGHNITYMALGGLLFWAGDKE